MRIISRKMLREASAKHGEWEASLNGWYKVAKAADWNHFEDVKRSWKNSDRVGKFVVFDISHNKCRLIAHVKYEWKTIFLKRILSHAEYDRKEWQKE